MPRGALATDIQPFWKLEDDGTGSAEWVEARDSDDKAAAKW